MITLPHAIGLGASMAICFGAAGLGSLLTKHNVQGWYAALRKPPWTPPNWVFGPVWSALYFAMAVAAWLIWCQTGRPGARLALVLFAVQLVLNVGWSGIFFTARRPGLAFAEILLLGLVILATLFAFWRLSRAAGWLMAPYLAWVGFAAVLNYKTWRLNA